MNIKALVLGMFAIAATTTTLNGQELDSISPDVLKVLSFRNIGPATTSGRIVDLAVNPKNKSEFYIAAAYGGVWKTTNSGTTFSPIFDNYGTQSIGCLRINSSNPYEIWVGTGENNNQRSVGYGNGIYRSLDGGKSFENLGLKNSEHIGMIQLLPGNSNVVYVAAYGPVWKEGGERGLYKTEDAGKTWNRILHVSDNTGCNEVHLDPTNSNIIYAAFHQRRRHEWTYLGGGPESCIQKSSDGGKTWKKLNSGLPSGDLGRITLAPSPAKPGLIYAMIEGAEGKGGIYVSYDYGESWSKTNSFNTAGNYYQEIFADPIDAQKFYVMDTYLKVSKDGGNTLQNYGENNKHVDNHAIWVDPDNTMHSLVGCDGGLYETFDQGKTWNYKDNLPITQFYRVTVDNAAPFYNVYGGTQDNNTLGGPSSNGSANGIPNSEWFVTVGGDGFKSQIDPTDPNIVYSQWQYGGLIRYDRRTGEQIDIKPLPTLNQKGYRWNWDAPLIISNHNPARLYFASNKVLRSNDRGNTWEVISDDLSRGIDRNKLTIMGKVWSMDAVAKNQSTSIYGNITYLVESPVDENILFAGTDDGLFWTTTDAGKTWTKQSSFVGVPDMTLITGICASSFNKNNIYVTFDNHRKGDFKPYVLKSSDLGKTWTSISSNLPANGSVKTIQEDDKKEGLLFLGTEFGFFVSNNSGKKWTQWKTNLPPVPIKDIAIQKRESDLALATFGRGFVIADDYHLLREVNKEKLEKEAFVFSVKPAKIYNQKQPLGGSGNAYKGASYYQAPNPAVGATIYFNIKNEYKTLKAIRQEKEAKLIKENKNVYYPSADSIRLEAEEEAPYLIFSILDSKGVEVRRLKAAANKGMNKLVWDLRHQGGNPLTFGGADLSNPYKEPENGPQVSPGIYTVKMYVFQNGKITSLGNTETIKCDYLYEPKLTSVSASERHNFIMEMSELRRNISASSEYLQEINNNLGIIKKSIFIKNVPDSLSQTISKLQAQWNEISIKLYGDNKLAAREFETAPGIYDRIETAFYGMDGNIVGPTNTQITAYKDAKSQFQNLVMDIVKLDTEYQKLCDLLDKLKIPYTPGRKFFLGK